MKLFFQQYLFISSTIVIELFSPSTSFAQNAEDSYYQQLKNPNNRDPKKKEQLRQQALNSEAKKQNEDLKAAMKEQEELDKQRMAEEKKDNPVETAEVMEPETAAKPSSARRNDSSTSSSTTSSNTPASKLNLSEDEVPKEIQFPAATPIKTPHKR